MESRQPDRPDPNVRVDVGGWISGPCLSLPTMPDDETEQLDYLRVTWRDKYRVEFNNEVWSARRMGNATKVITADSANELRGFIWQDFINWQTEVK